jgi:hypothetical protein
MPLPNKDGKPFVLSDTLRDLALLRASDLDLATLVPTTVTKDDTQVKEGEAAEESLKNSYQYIRLARNIVKTNDRGDVDVQGQRIERVREELSNVDEGLMDA